MDALCPQKLLEGKRDVVRCLATSVPAASCPVQSLVSVASGFRDADQALPLGSSSELAPQREK